MRASPLGLLFSLACCASGPRVFPLAPRMEVDPDLKSVTMPCRKDPTKKEPNHIACAPETYVSPLAWDAIDNSIALPIVSTLHVPDGHEATNVNSIDEVPNSSWFINRIGEREMSMEEITRGACHPDVLLDGENVKDGEWVIDAGKTDGSSPGFRVTIPGKGKYLFKSDDAQGERPSAASVLGAAIYNVVGFNTSCEQVVYFKRSALKLTPGLTVKDNSGITKNFDQAALDKIYTRASKRGDLIRMQASAWLPGRLIGPFEYKGTRKDDPNDVVPHEDRRELRGGRILAAWIEHHDAREQNSMDSWIADQGKKSPDSSPGYVRHYYLDTSDCFGSNWEQAAITPRLGYTYLLDWKDMGIDFVTLGAIDHPWDHAVIQPGFEQFYYYKVNEFVPDQWKNEYPNPAFSNMTEHDGAWMARILAHLPKEAIPELVKMGKFTEQKNSDFLSSVMEGRLAKILDRYLTRLSPVTHVKIDHDELCAVDLAELRGVRGPEHFHYEAHVGASTLAVKRGERGKICMTLPHREIADGVRDDSSDRYTTLTISDGIATGELVVNYYDLGARGFWLAGLERPDRE